MTSMWLKMRRRKRGRPEKAPTPTLTNSLVVEQLVGASTVALSALGSLAMCGAGVGEGNPPDEMDDIFAGLRIFIYLYQISYENLLVTRNLMIFTMGNYISSHVHHRDKFLCSPGKFYYNVDFKYWPKLFMYAYRLSFIYAGVPACSSCFLKNGYCSFFFKEHPFRLNVLYFWK